MLPILDPFATLGVSPGCDERDLRRAFRELARVHHPDKGGDPDRFRKITEAYDAACDVITSGGTSKFETIGVETRPRYDWRRGRSSFETGGVGKNGEAKRRGRDDGGGGAPRGRREHKRDSDRTSRDEHNHDDDQLSLTESDTDASSSDGSEDDVTDSHETRNAVFPLHSLDPAVVENKTCPVTSVAVSPHGIVACACLEAGVRVWCGATGKVVYEYQHILPSTFDDDEKTKGKREKINPRASDAWWVFDNTCLLVAWDDGQLVVWHDVLCGGDDDTKKDATNSVSYGQTVTKDPKFGTALVLTGHSKRVVAAAWCGDDNEPTSKQFTLCSASLDTTVRVWRFERKRIGQMKSQSQAVPFKYETVFFSKTVLKAHASGVTCCAISSDGSYLASGDTSGVFCVWALHSNALAHVQKWVPGEDDAITKCAFLPSKAPYEGKSQNININPFHGHRLCTAHYSRDNDSSRLLLWRVGRRNVHRTWEEAIQEEEEDDDRGDSNSDSDCDSDSDSEPQVDHREKYLEIRGYIHAIPGGLRTYRGRVSDITLGTLEDQSTVLLACGVHGWVTAIDVDVLTTLYGLEVKGFCERNVSAAPQKSVHKVKFIAPGVFATANEDGTVRVYDAEDGSEMKTCVFHNKQKQKRKGKVWSIGSFRNDFGKKMVIAGSADGETACWEV